MTTPPDSAKPVVPESAKPVVPESASRKRPREDEEDEDSVLYVSAPPPAVRTEKAIYSRSHGIFKRKKDGSFYLGDNWNSMWSGIRGGRQALYSIFEKVGYNPDWFAEQWIEIQKNGFGSFGDALQWFETHAKVKYNKVHDSMGEHYSKNPGSISVV